MVTGGSRGDGELVAAARGGDKDAFGILVGRHRPMVLALATRLLGDSGGAADVTQEATIAALVGLERLRSPERFGAWYAGITLNIARRLLRAAAAGPLADDYPDDRLGPEEQAEKAEGARRVREAVAGLADGQREAVLAFYWRGLTHAEAAVELGVTPGAVKARLHQARSALKPRLASYIEANKETRAMTSTPKSTWVEMDIVEVRRSDEPDTLIRSHAIVLHERSGERRLPIYVGPAEAIALSCSLETAEMPRPMTYQLAVNLVAATGSRLKDVRISRLAESTFYAVIDLDGPAGGTEVDARPSDALNLAVISAVPVLVDAAVLDDPNAAGHMAWEQFPTSAPDLAAEARQRQEAMLAGHAGESEATRRKNVEP